MRQDTDKERELERSLKRASKTYQNELIPWILRPGNTTLVFIQEQLNKIFPPRLNPMYFLGAISLFLFWILIITGSYLFLFYDMSVEGAYESVQYITKEQKYYGGIMRSMHRYAADGLAISILLHVAQVFFSDRFRRARWVAWVSGSVILFWVWFEGISGYVLVWDEKGKMVAVEFARLLDALPITVEPVSRTFLTNETVTSVLFFVTNYLHLMIPCFLLIMAWIHYMRLSRPLISPPRPVALVILAGLLGLSLVKPAVSMGPADLSKLLGRVEIDWFYLIPFPFMDAFRVAPGAMWIAGSAALALFTALPWLIPAPALEREKRKAAAKKKARKQFALVDLEKCKGCNLCQPVCPFEAVSITPRTDGRPYDTQVEIFPARCEGCGFCVTACPTSGISMGEMTRDSMLEDIKSLMAPAEGEKPVILCFMCERSMTLSNVLSDDERSLAGEPAAAVMVIPCAGVLEPDLVGAAFKDGAKGVVVVGCRPLDCHYREGNERIEEATDPANITGVDESAGERIKVMLVSRFEDEEVVADIKKFLEIVRKPSGGKTAANDMEGALK
ncbi:MAG: hydrogenase iron-sulfur subunit [Candidatus Nitrospinota bacterium M3_3B_026]